MPGRSYLDRQADQEARPAHRAVSIGPVLRPDAAAMRLDDLFRDREAEPRMRAEFLAGRPLAVEGVEDRGQLVLRDAGALVLHSDQNGPAVGGGADADLAIRWAERDGIGDDVEKNLRQAALDARHHKSAATAVWVGRQIEDEARRTVGPGRVVHIDERTQHRPDIGRRELEA